MLSSGKSKLVLPASDGFEKLTGIGIVFKMVAHWLQKVVDGCSNCWFKITWMEVTTEVIFLKLCIIRVDLDSTILWLASNFELLRSWQDYVLNVVNDWIIFDDLRWAVCLLHFLLHISSSVLHKDC